MANGVTDGRKLMDQARAVKAREGTLAAADHLQSKGISYDLALIALVGALRARAEFGLDFESESVARRRRSAQRRRNVVPLKAVA